MVGGLSRRIGRSMGGRWMVQWGGKWVTRRRGG